VTLPNTFSRCEVSANTRNLTSFLLCCITIFPSVQVPSTYIPSRMWKSNFHTPKQNYTTVYCSHNAICWSPVTIGNSALLKLANSLKRNGCYTLTTCSRVLHEKLTGSQLVKKFDVFYGTQISITSFIRVCHLRLSWVRSIQFMPPHPAMHTTCFNIQKVCILWTQRRVELGYNAMNETQYFFKKLVLF
jgi:predicted DNA-binding ribbon-helix-helix protein